MVSHLQNSDFSLTLTLLGKNANVVISYEGILAARLPTFPEGLKSTGFLLDQSEALETAGIMSLSRFVQAFNKIDAMLKDCRTEADVFNTVCHLHPKSRGLSLEWGRVKNENDILMASLFESGFMGAENSEDGITECSQKKKTKIEVKTKTNKEDGCTPRSVTRTRRETS